MSKKTSNLEVAKNIIVSYLNNSINFDSLSSLYQILHDDKNELRKHIEALHNIFENALKELDENINEKVDDR